MGHGVLDEAKKESQNSVRNCRKFKLVFSFMQSLSFFGDKVGEETLSNRVA